MKTDTGQLVRFGQTPVLTIGQWITPDSSPSVSVSTVTFLTVVIARHSDV